MDEERKPKRLSGWRKEQELLDARPAEPACQKQGPGCSSALCSRLLQLWAIGTLSAKLMAELAQLAMLDGAKSDDLLQLAKLRGFGSSPANCQRDLLCRFSKEVGFQEVFPVKVLAIDPKSSKETWTEAGMLLPHIMFSDLAGNYPDQFHAMFATKDVEAFWEGVAKKGDPRLRDLQEHSLLGKRDKDRKYTAPLFIHGDGVEFQTRDSLMVWSFGGFLCPFASLSSHVLIAGFPKSCTHQRTWDPLNELMKWSFEALAKGKHPEQLPGGEPLPKGFMQDVAGQPLVPGTLFRGIIWSIVGDNEFFTNSLLLPHWGSRRPCWQCDCQKATKKHPCQKGKSVKILNPDKQLFNYVPTGSRHPLFQVPGLTVQMVRQDGLHILYAKGVGSHLIGSVLQVLAYWDGKGRQKVSATNRLAVVFKAIQEVYVRNKTPVRLTNLRLSMFTDPQKPHAVFPVLKCKAAECKHLGPCLLLVLKAMLDTGDELQRNMIECLEAFCNLTQLYDQAGLFLTKEEFDEVMNLDRRFFLAYDWLHMWAKNAQRLLFHVVHKHHTMMHLNKDSYYLNPRYCGTFKAEDFVGCMSKLGHGISFGLASTALPGKLLTKYMVLLHLQISMPGFGWKDEDDNP